MSFGERIRHWHLLVMAVPADMPSDVRGPALLSAKDMFRDLAAAKSIAGRVARVVAYGG
ncbi:hypothetical protein LI90_1941 [Carbonactinospora thermoautotrophica]|uniref:Uncharacterized protein n=1 Tax=Carbonactinospora thermoautotrophica TaxID=1469144 RepID=A0A132MST5_9ACTN|nr:hypothetical protein LI90_1941 [Carbonactinospora thermoautotrophica]